MLKNTPIQHSISVLDQRNIVTRRLILAIVAIIPIFVAFVGKTLGSSGLLIALLGPIGLSTAYLLSKKLEWIVFVALMYAFTVGPILMGLPGIPVGIAMDAMLLLGIGTWALHRIKWDQWEEFNIPGAGIIGLWIAYHLIQIANPTAQSRAAWFYVMRPAVAYPFLFLATYHFAKGYKQTRTLLALFTLGVLTTALWGLSQHLFGYFKFEFDFLTAADAIHLVYIQGRYRIFGTLMSPAQYGVAMAMFSVFFFVLGIYIKSYKRLRFLVISILCFVLTVYSGTRSAFVVYPVSFLFLLIVERSGKMIGTAVVGAALFVVLMIIPTNNYHIKRMQSTFKTEEDASFQVRAENRKRITPFILSHPLGGGLGSTGVWGMRFSPGSPLAQFAPDSGYLRVAVELGWIGLILYVVLMLRLFWLSFHGLQQSTGWRKAVIAATLAALSALFVVEWAQDILGKLPFNQLFWILMAMTIRLGERHD